MAEVVGIVSSILAILEASKKIVSFLDDVKHASVERNRLHIEVLGAITWLGALKTKVEESKAGGPELSTLESLAMPDGLLAEMQKLLDRIARKLNLTNGHRSLKGALIWPFDKKEIQEMISTVQQYNSCFVLALQNDSIELLKELDKKVDTLNKFVFDTKAEEAGCGKTVLCTTIVQTTMEHCQSASNQESALLYFYFDFQDPTKQTSGQLIRSLISQGLTQVPVIPSALMNLYNQCSQGRIQPTLESLILTFHALLLRQDDTYVIIDAMDECTDREAMLNMITQILSWKTNVRILATSRKEPDILEALQSLTTHQICIESSLVDADIRTFISQKLRNDPKFKRWPPEIHSEIETTLVKGANGMFQWVVCQLDELRKCLKYSQIHQTLANLPKTLNITYGQILSRINDLWHQDVSRVLECMVYSHRSLGTKELADFLAIDMEQHRYDNDSGLMDSSDIFVMCPNLITADTYAGKSHQRSHGEPVKFVHFSVKEYLLSKDGAAGPAARIPFVAEVHGRIAEMCLVYLIEHIQPRERRLSIGDLIHNKWTWYPTSKLKYVEEKFPLAGYAATRWTHHARSADPGNNRLNELILTFLQSDVLCVAWLNLRYDSRGVMSVNADPLFNASAEGLAQIVRLMPFQDADLPRTYGMRNTETALSVASRNGHLSVVQVLIDRGAQINDPTGETCALTSAAQRGQLECVKMLLAHGADIQGTARIRGHFDPLYAALVRERHEVAWFLLEKGADPFLPSRADIPSPFWEASKSRNSAILESLLARGQKARDAMGAILGHITDPAIAQLLLDHGADVNEVDQYGRSVLRLAMIVPVSSVTDLYIAHGAVLDSNLSTAEFEYHQRVKKGR